MLIYFQLGKNHNESKPSRFRNAKSKCNWQNRDSNTKDHIILVDLPSISGDEENVVSQLHRKCRGSIRMYIQGKKAIIYRKVKFT